MSAEKKHIDNLFKVKLAGHASPLPEDIWGGIDDALPKKLFFRFRFEHMNIYYCALIVVCFLFSTVSLVYTLSNKGIDGSERPALTVPLADSSANAGSSYSSFEKTNITSGNKKKSQQKVNNYSTSSYSEKSLVGTPLQSDSLGQLVIKDTAASVVEVKNIKVNPFVPTKKMKKIVYVTDYDTIVKIDTLRTKKKRR